MEMLNYHLFIFGGYIARVLKYWSLGDYEWNGKMNLKKSVASLFLIGLFYLAFSVVNMGVYYDTTFKALAAIFIYITVGWAVDSIFVWLMDIIEARIKKQI
jgi:hypothetical protein